VSPVGRYGVTCLSRGRQGLRSWGGPLIVDAVEGARGFVGQNNSDADPTLYNSGP
jgi:hypothetical protein